MYDLLNEIVREIAPLWVTLSDQRSRIVKQQLPSSFADVALRGKQDALAENEIVERRGLPPRIANWYVREAAAFRVLRAARDAVIHRGLQLPTIFDLGERGLAVSKEDHFFRELAIWNGVTATENGLVPLRLAFARIVFNMLRATQRLAEAVASTTSLPQAIGDGIRVFLRSAVTHRLLEIPCVIDDPWGQNGVIRAPAKQTR